MRHRIRKGIFQLFCTALLCAGLLCTAAAQADCAILIGNDLIKKGNTIWFGSKGGPLASGWRVLNEANDTALLLTENLVGNTVFNSSKSAGNKWSGSAAESWCNTWYNNQFTAAEQKAVKSTTTVKKNDSHG